MTLTAERSPKIDTWVYAMDDKREQSLLAESDAIRLGTVKLDLKGSTEEVMRQVSYQFQGEPIRILLKSDASPVIQSPGRIPIPYRERLRTE